MSDSSDRHDSKLHRSLSHVMYKCSQFVLGIQLIIVTPEDYFIAIKHGEVMVRGEYISRMY